ncbi:hypothetical protein [Microvirga antarctica]|uniref:hypothetical protein n=1 Tax=Microvirga antarctica TaxID=2819233 RepID=UPI001B3025E9|nr:hypothetical protein [Microvirga antarctica]
MTSDKDSGEGGALDASAIELSLRFQGFAAGPGAGGVGRAFAHQAAPHGDPAWANAWARLTAVRVYLALSADPLVGRTERGVLLKALARHIGTSEAYLRKLATRYFYAQSLDMFLPRRMGRAVATASGAGSRGRRIDPRVAAIMAEEVAVWRQAGADPARRMSVYERVMERAAAEGLRPPAYPTLLARMKRATTVPR